MPVLQQQVPQSKIIQELKNNITYTNEKQEIASTTNNSEPQDLSNSTSSVKSSQQTLTKQLEYSEEEIEKEFKLLSIEEQEEYKEIMVESYLQSMLNSKMEQLLFYIWDDAQRDTKKTIDLIFDALKNPVKKPENFELKFNPQHSLEGKLYELNRIYNKDKDILGAKCILCERDSQFEYKLLLEQVPKYTIKAIIEHFNWDEFKEYKNYISNKFKDFETPSKEISL